MIKPRLMTPGPTALPPEVLASASQQLPHHRTPGYREALREVQAGLQGLLGTTRPVLMYSASGTGAMEACVANLTSPGDPVIVASGGVFGERWGKICERYGLDVVAVKAEWGEPVDPAAVDRALSARAGIKLVFTTLSETSTGVDHPVEEIAKICRARGAAVAVDGISGVGAVPFQMDAWGVDAVVIGSQKALMVPPGLAFLALSDHAWKLAEAGKHPKFYFSAEAALKAWSAEALPDTPFTSPISLLLQMRESFRVIQRQPLPEWWAWYARLAGAVQAAMGGLGLSLFAKSHRSRVLTSVVSPEGVPGSKLVKKVRERWGLSLAPGQGAVKDKIFRIGHVGYVDELDVVTAVAAVEMGLKELGAPITLGAGVRAAQDAFLRSSDA